MTKIRKIWNNLPQEIKQFIFAWDTYFQSLNQPKKLVAIKVSMTMKRLGSQIVGGLKLGDYEEVMNITESEEYSDGLLTVQKYYYE